MEDPILRRRDRMPTITVRGDIDEALQPPEVSMEMQNALQPIIGQLPAGYRIEMAGSIEESAKANAALAAVFPIMLALMLTIIMFQVRSFSAMAMVMLTAPLGLIGAVPAAAVVPSALRLQRHPGSDRPCRHPDAQHADPDRADPYQSGSMASIPTTPLSRPPCNGHGP